MTLPSLVFFLFFQKNFFPFFCVWTCDGWLFRRHPWRAGVGYILTHTRIISRTLANFCLSFLYLWFSSKDYSFGEQSVVKQETPKKKVDQQKVETIKIDDSDDKNVSVFFFNFSFINSLFTTSEEIANIVSKSRTQERTATQNWFHFLISFMILFHKYLSSLSLSLSLFPPFLILKYDFSLY